MRPTPAPQRPAPSTSDDVAEAFEELQKYAEILRPEDVDEPILGPTVAAAVHEWMVELNNASELTAVKVQPRRLALLFGPPGTGKTTLAHHIASRRGVPLVCVQSERIIGSYLGETGRAIGNVFDLLKPVEGKCVLLLDEFDALAMKRQQASSGAVQERNQALTVLLTRIERFQGIGLAATNTKDAIDSAMWRRFGMQISVDLPGENERFAIIRKYCLPFDLDDDAIDILVKVTRGCSPSLLRQLMEGMKRTLILAPKLHLAVTGPAEMFAHLVAGISPPPEMQQPPLWSDPRALEGVEAMAWPPKREEKRP